MSCNILRYEEISINAFPALLTEVYDGWILRYSNGYSYRANSVNPIYSSTISLEEKITYCEQKYFEKLLPCVFKLTDQVDHQVNLILESKGYQVEHPAKIMEYELTGESLNPSEQVRYDGKFEEQWLNDFMILNGSTGDSEKDTIKSMFTKIGNPVVCASIYHGAEMAACGIGVYEDKHIGLYDIRVLEKYRLRGYGTQVCKKIMEEGRKLGALSVYLQVASNNKIAIKLYEKLGFHEIYTYWYRVKTAEKVSK